MGFGRSLLPLTPTFITPYGRYCFNKLPFGITSAPEHFQKQMCKILSGMEGVLCQMDDVLIFGKDEAENKTKQNKTRILGHLIDSQGIQADPAKTTAIQEMEYLPASRKRTTEYSTAQAANPVCSTVINYCHHRWPEKSKISTAIKPYWKARGELATCNNLTGSSYPSHFKKRHWSEYTMDTKES